MNSIVQFFKNMGTAQLVVLGVIIAISIGFFSMIIGQVSQSPMAVLFADLDPRDASSIIQKLESQNIEYKVEGSQIKVPSTQVDALRLSMAGEGLSGGVVGMEIFDREGNFGRTSFELNINKLRAIEGELSRTISYIRGVKEARVHIVLPERQAFQREAQEPSASIMLQSSGSIGERQARTIQALVASAIAGMSPDNVTISDSSGRLLTDGSSGSSLGTFSDIEDARIAKENLFRSRIESLIGRRVGSDRVRAEVSIDMTTKRVTSNETFYNPDGQVIASQTISETQSKEANKSGNVSVSNNLPDAAGGGDANQTGNSATSANETTNFDNSRTETLTISEPGEVTGIRVSILIDGIRTLDEETGDTIDYAERGSPELSLLEDLAKTAIPFQEDRDQINVVSMRFADAPIKPEITQSFDLLGFDKQDVISVIQTAVLGLVAILFLLMVVKPVVARIIEAIPDAPPPVDPNQLADHSGDGPAVSQLIGSDGMPISQDVIAAAAAGDETATRLILAAKQAGTVSDSDMSIDTRIDVAQVEGRIEASAMQKVADIIKSNPDETVAIVRNWLYAD